MRRLVFLAAFLTAASAASGADLRTPYKAPMQPEPAPYTWSGAYLGIFLGGAINTTKPVFSDGVTAIDVGTMPRGVLGGAEIGYDFQFSQNWVFGLFAEGALANINDNGALSSAGVTMLANGVATNYFLAAGGRLGFLITPTTLIYGKAGVAGVGEKPNWQVASAQQFANDTSVGWVAGGGIEHRLSFAPNWSIKLEYDHYQAGEKVLSFTDSAGAVISTGTNKFSIDAVRAGLGLRF